MPGFRAIAGVAAAMLLVASGSALAQDAQGGLIKRESGLGKLDATGWTRATTSNGALSVQLPCLYEEIVEKTERGGIGHALLCRRADGLVFTVGHMGSTSGAQAQTDFTELQQGMSGAGPVASIDYAGQPGFELKWIRNGECYALRLIRQDSANVMIAISGKGDSCKGLDAAAAKFFPSLELRKP